MREPIKMSECRTQKRKNDIDLSTDEEEGASWSRPSAQDGHSGK